jgi:hypothetical protein
MVIGAGVVFAKIGVDEGMIGRLVVDPQEEELLRLKVWLEFEGGDLKRGSIS